jgi:hypothetical protein
VVCLGAGFRAIPDSFRDQSSLPELILKTALDTKRNEIFATATLAGGSGSGFGQGIYITCNAMPIVDTRNGNARPNTGAYVLPQDGLFTWSYEGPDTNFEVEFPAQTQPILSDSLNGKTIFLADSLNIGYTPAGACSQVQLVLGDEFQDSIRPVTPFDTATGAIFPTWIGSIGLQPGAGTIAIARSKWIYFPTPQFRWVFVEDSVTSKPADVIWQ